MDRDLGVKLKIAKKIFSWHVGDSRKFMLAKISHYTVFRKLSRGGES